MVRPLSIFPKWLLLGLVCQTLVADGPPPWDRYLRQTYHGLQCLRRTSGFIADTAQFDPQAAAAGNACPLKDFLLPTSPTNIALDLLVQREMAESVEVDLKPLANENIRKIISALNRVDYHHDTGLFYNQYDSDTLEVRNFYLSSIDNLHLAYALWVIAATYEDAAVKTTADTLFRRMNFNMFYDPTDGLMRGGIKKTTTGWVPEVWKYQYFGSESRSLYSLGKALHLVSDPQFLEKAFKVFFNEVFIWKDGDVSKRLLALWDGGAFQLLLPSLLVSERVHSQQLKELFSNYSEYVLSESKRMNYSVPASFSACRFLTFYNGEAGSPFLVSHLNRDITVPALLEAWDQVMTPHAAFLAAVGNPKAFGDLFPKVETQGTPALFKEGIGFWDGIYVKGGTAGQVVPYTLSLDQEMVALAIFQILSPDTTLIGERALLNDHDIRGSLMEYFNRADRLLDGTPTPK